MNYQVGQWTGEDWIARVVTLKVVPKRCPSDTLLYLWPKEEWVWANTVTVEEAATKLPAISVNTDKVRVKLALMLTPYGRPKWVASEIGVTNAAITQLQKRRSLSRRQYIPTIDQVREDIGNGLQMRQLIDKWGVSRQSFRDYFASQGTSYRELMNEYNDRRRTMGLTPISRNGRIKKTPGKTVATDTRLPAQPKASSALPAGRKRRGE